ncbi:MAG: type II toxin-antitoxin system prevent-host-death family antitoxin [Nitrospira sp. SB0675_bin_23]|nr:type II toxin-antitoxin system prevent-host-death family antitoxin [Nitrospira sp. SB0661_bin_20]MYH01182.1 type II toxin-antitoxin system prevent-host-death family antitoxin [Nitrospira sp. SB0675_bin_23]MYJ22772.1 type II toxin-antitoxin system prevent-host-death family antitoxin [Nitrospira sp. SB0673_bin_12]
MKVNMHEAKSQLSRLAELARQGEEVVICKAGEPWVHLMPYREQMEKRKLGGLEGQIWMSPDFDDEDEELIEAIEQSKIFPDED